MWNRCVRRVFRLPYRTHTRFLTSFLNAPHVLEQVFARFVGMLRAMKMSDNAKIQFLAKHVIFSPTSITARNLYLISQKLQIGSEEVTSVKTFRNTLYHLTNEDTSIIQVIKEMKDNMCDLLNDEEQNDFMDFLCSK